MADPLAFLGEHRDEALDVAESARYLLAADGATRRRALLPRLAAEFPWLPGALKAVTPADAPAAMAALDRGALWAAPTALAPLGPSARAVAMRAARRSYAVAY